MFEKEAEEIMMQKVIKENDCIMTPCKTLEDCQLYDFCFDDMVDAFKDGVQVLSEKGLLVIYKGDFFCWFEYSPNADNIKLRKWEEPIAWKEIVLPELPKEIKEND